MLDLPDTRPSRERIADGAYLLRGFALDKVAALLPEIEQIETAAAYEHSTDPVVKQGYLLRQEVMRKFRNSRQSLAGLPPDGTVEDLLRLALKDLAAAR